MATTTTTMCENQRLQTYKAATIIHVLLADAFLSFILRLADACTFDHRTVCIVGPILSYEKDLFWKY